MLVENILARKGESVVTISADATLGDLVSLLAKHNIGAVVVADGEAMAGIVSERDVVRLLAQAREDMFDAPVSSLMTRNPTTVSRSETIDDAMGKMTHGRFRHLPVLEDGRLIGLVSIGDVVKRKIERAEEEAGRLREYIAS